MDLTAVVSRLVNDDKNAAMNFEEQRDMSAIKPEHVLVEYGRTKTSLHAGECVADDDEGDMEAAEGERETRDCRGRVIAVDVSY